MARALSGDHERAIDVEDQEEDELDLNSLKQEIYLKLLVLGDLGVGKSSLIKRYTGEPGGLATSSDYKVSIETGYQLKQVELEGRLINIQLWDVPGHERYGEMTRAYYKYAHGALIVFDLARPETFDSALGWLSDVTEKLFDEKAELNGVIKEDQPQSPLPSNNEMPIILLANKCDLPDLKVSRQKYSTYVKENGLLCWYETSSRDPSNMALAVRRLVEYILETDPTVKVARDNDNIWRNR